ncbi:efflux RND transporter permease subunit [Streptomyces sp. S399]|uniref:efflux RND transporter permease subunit n=1 Tax=Streptomyces sp. S399 TaxID=3096009 RepID=UPI0039C499ED
MAQQRLGREDHQRLAERTVHLPPGYHLEWAGELDNLTNAVARLEVVVPISLLLILLLLYANFGSIRDSLLAFSAIPMAIIGARPMSRSASLRSRPMSE